jgi:hypothetical protein
MPARDQSRHEYEAHGWSLAHVLVLALASCTDPEVFDPAPRDPNDLDADGVPNAADVCPENYDPEQHDDDGDGAGDQCDVCPAIPDNQIDTPGRGFGDGIGDACDPRPAIDGDQLGYFDAFAGTKIDWIGEGWGIGADVARAVTTSRFESPFDLQGDGLWAEIHVSTLIKLAGGGVEVAVDGNGESGGLRCGVETDTDDDGRDEIVAEEIDGAVVRVPLAGKVKPPLRISVWRTIDIDRHAKMKCIVNGIVIEMPVDEAASAGTFAFASRGFITDVSSLVVYTFPINPCSFGDAGLRRCD